MEKYDNLFNIEQEELLKRYIKEPWFKELNDYANICDLDCDENTILQHIKNYVWIFLARSNEEEIENSAKKFLQFLQDYKDTKEPCFKGKSEGDTFNTTEDLLWLSNGYHIYGNLTRFQANKKALTANGMYSFGSYIGTDHSIYLAKRSMKQKALPVSTDDRKEVDYNSIIAQCAFEYFQEPVAEYYLLRDTNNPFRAILSKNFLKDNQELIHFSDLYSDPYSTDIYSERIAMMKSNIEMRYKNLLGEEKTQELLDKLRLQYCRQEFMKLAIGPMDCNLGNTALVLTSKVEQCAPEIDISPAYDLDLSFNIAQSLSSKGNMSLMKTNDGRTANIKSFINEFKDVSGFKEFIADFYKRIEDRHAANEIVANAFEKTNFTFFNENSTRYIDFLNDRFEQVMEAYRETFIESKGDEENEAVLE